jgi:hypothetical protein
VVLHKPTITNVNAAALQAVVCVGGSSSVVIERGQFVANNGTPLAVVGKGAEIVVKESLFSNNVLHADDSEKIPGHAAGMFMEGGSGLVESSTFTNHSAVKAAGAIGLNGTALLRIRHSVLQNNSGGTVAVSCPANTVAGSASKAPTCTGTAGVPHTHMHADYTLSTMLTHVVLIVLQACMVGPSPPRELHM